MMYVLKNGIGFADFDRHVIMTILSLVITSHYHSEDSRVLCVHI